MLKVLKNGFDTTPFKNEFNAIQHGDYGTFLRNIESEIPFMVIYINGKFAQNKIIQIMNLILKEYLNQDLI